MLQDKQAIIHVLGSILKNPQLLSETEKYQLEKEDFPERFHKIIFASINNLYRNGAEIIDEIEIDGFLSQHNIQHEIFNQNNGIEYLQQIKEIANEENFEYHYNRLKKFSLLREMDGLGFDISEVYDDTLLNPREREELQAKFDQMDIKDILLIYEEKMVGIRDKFESNSESISIHASEGIEDLLDRLEQSPDIGLPLNSEIVTSVSRGARKKKFYLRSAITGFGKTRHMIGDACRLSAAGWYDPENKEWVKNDLDENSVIVSTEMVEEEIQTPLIAYISAVPEYKIVQNLTNEEEKERVRYAANILKNSKIYYEYLPDFNIEDIERVIEKNIIKNDVKYVFFDYIHSSIGILQNFAKKGGVNLREDQILLLMADKLKQLCNKYEIFLMSATQLNGEWKEAWKKGEEIDQNFIRGSKAIGDKLDFGSIMLPPSKKELNELEEVLSKRFGKQPNTVTHIFKNRGNRYKSIKIFSYVNMDTIRIEDLFVTDVNNRLIQVDKLKIHKKETQKN